MLNRRPSLDRDHEEAPSAEFGRWPGTAAIDRARLERRTSARSANADRKPGEIVERSLLGLAFHEAHPNLGQPQADQKGDPLGPIAIGGVDGVRKGAASEQPNGEMYVCHNHHSADFVEFSNDVAMELAFRVCVGRLTEAF